MKSLIALATVLSFQFAQAQILCDGVTESKKRVLLKIKATGKKDYQGFQTATLERVVQSRYSHVDQVVEGCEEALIAGERNGQLITSLKGDLYIECDGDGDAGYMNLKKVSGAKYVGTVHAPNGKHELDMGDEEEMSVTCQITK